MFDERYAVYNPQQKPIAELPVIYGYGKPPSHTGAGGIAIAEDGTHLANHFCSHEGFMLSDLGILRGSSPYKHQDYQTHYPDGYRMEFVSYKDVVDHTGLQQALANAK